MAIDLGPQEETTIPIDLSPQSVTRPLAQDLAEKRAAKFAMSKVTNKSYDEILQALQNGQEDNLRQESAATVTMQRATEVERQVQEHASRLQGPMTQAEANNIRMLAIGARVQQDPTTVFEEFYSKEFMNQIEKDPDNIFDQYKQEDPPAADTDKLHATNYLTKIQIIDKRVENLRHVIEDQSWVGYGVDFGKMLIPFYDEIMRRGNVKDVSRLDGFLGTNLTKQRLALLRKSVPEFTTEFSRIMDELEASNPQIALAFAMSMKGQSTTEEAINNAFTPIEVLGVTPFRTIGKGIRKVTKAIEGREALKSTIKSAATKDADAPLEVVAADAVGDMKEAAVKKTTHELLTDWKGKSDPNVEAMKALPDVFQGISKRIQDNPGRFGQELVNKLKNRFEYVTGQIMDTIAHVSQVERIPAVTASQKVIRALAEDMIKDFPKIADNAILNMVHRWDPHSNVWFIDYALGDTSGEMFKQWIKAKAYAKSYGIADATVEKTGGRYYIVLSRSLPEDHPIVRDNLITNPEALPKEGILNSLGLGRIRSSEDVLSTAQSKNRSVATHARAKMQSLAEEMGQDIKNLSHGAVTVDPVTGRNRFPWFYWKAVPGLTVKGKKGRWNDWNTAVKQARHELDPVTGKPGYFFEDPLQLENYYLGKFGRLPDEPEIQAYFTYVNLVELDRVMRNIAVYRAKARVGTEQHRLIFNNEEGKKVTSEWVEGVIRKELPNSNEPILVMGVKAGDEYILNPSKAGYLPKLNKLQKEVKTAQTRVFELYDPEKRPFKSFGKVGNTYVRYVVSPNFETKALSWEQVPRRGGGHFDYDYEWWIKQAMVRPDVIGSSSFKHVYEGDATIMGAVLRSVGVKAARHMDEARILLKKKDVAGAKAYLQANLPQLDFDEFHSWFKPTYLNGVKQHPRLGLNEPIQVVRRNATIGDGDGAAALMARYPTTFKDGTKKGSIARMSQVEYTGERDAYEITAVYDRGTRNNPLFTFEPAEFIDPIPSINRAMYKIIDSNWMTDYKVSAVEHWLKAAQPYLRDGEEAFYAPFHYFYKEPQWRKDADALAVRKLEDQRQSVRQFLGMPSNWEKTVHSLAQSFADQLYNARGPESKALKVFQKIVIDPPWTLHTLSDPTRFIRSVTFHSSLGLFAWPQLWVQMQTVANVMAVAGFSKSIPSIYASYLHMLYRLNPQMLNHLDTLATKIRIPGFAKWKTGELKESIRHMNLSGFDKVGGEYAPLDDTRAVHIIQGNFKSFLDAGTWFFRTGERYSRMAAWHTAYKEFRDANPIKAIDNIERNKILKRADFLSNNMTRASNSALHSGLASVPTQFLTYQLRLMELFLGKRLADTMLERTKIRARMMLTYGALYGFPTSIALTGIPAIDFIRSKAIEYGYVPGENYLHSLFMEGIPSMILAGITGGGDPSKGNWYNIPDRFGVQGMELMREFLHSDEGHLQFLMGAAGNKLADTLASTHPFWRWASQMPENADGPFKLKVEDFLEVGKNVSSINYGYRGIYAMNTMNWMSKKGMLLDKDISALNSLFMTTFGLSPLDAADPFIYAGIKKSREEAQKAGLDRFVLEFRRAIREHEKGNIGQALDFYNRAKIELIMSGYPLQKYGTALSIASQGHERLIDRLKWDVFFKNVPPGEERKNIELFKRHMDQRRRQEGQQ